jgi:hypothetical protein
MWHMCHATTKATWIIKIVLPTFTWQPFFTHCPVQTPIALHIQATHTLIGIFCPPQNHAFVTRAILTCVISISNILQYVLNSYYKLHGHLLCSSVICLVVVYPRMGQFSTCWFIFAFDRKFMVSIQIQLTQMHKTKFIQ